jgi:8-oxo-dGTP pyrophosphatase MutT (NUDIX family)
MPTIVSDTIQLHPFRRVHGEIEYLIVKRSPSDELCPGIWQVVTGGIDGSETARDAASRELAEETGLRASEWYVLPQVVSFYFEPRDRIMLAPVIACEVSASDQPVLSAEHTEYAWLPLDRCRELLEFPSHVEGMVLVDEFLRSRSLYAHD